MASCLKKPDVYLCRTFDVILHNLTCFQLLLQDAVAMQHKQAGEPFDRPIILVHCTHGYNRSGGPLVQSLYMSLDFLMVVLFWII